MIRKMLWHTLLAAAIVTLLGGVHQLFGSGTGLAALAGYASAADGPASRHDD